MPTVSRSGLPAWADAAVLSGADDAEVYFDAADAARRLSAAQKGGLPSLIEGLEVRMRGPGPEAREHFAEALLSIAIRVQPGIAETTGLAWAANLLDSLSRTPEDLIATAIEAARYRQFQFLNEVGPFIGADIAEPLRDRRNKIARLQAIEAAARSLPAHTTYATPDEAAKIIDEFGLRKAKTAIRPADRPEPDWEAEREKRLADTNFLRALHGKPAFTMAEWQDDIALRNSKRSDLADDLSDSISDVAL